MWQRLLQEPVEGYSNASIVHVPFQRITYGLGAVHRVRLGPVSRALELSDRQASTVFMDKQEYNTYLLVVPLDTWSTPRYFAITSGRFRAVMFDPKALEKPAFACDLKPTRDLIVPRGIGVVFQVQTANRASFVTVSHGRPRVKEIGSNLALLTKHLDSYQSDSAIDARTGLPLIPLPPAG